MYFQNNTSNTEFNKKLLNSNGNIGNRNETRAMMSSSLKESVLFGFYSLSYFFSSLSKNDLENPDILTDIGNAYYRKGNILRAKWYYIQALRKDGTCSRAMNNLGLVYRYFGDIPKARECNSAYLKLRMSERDRYNIDELSKVRNNEYAINEGNNELNKNKHPDPWTQGPLKSSDEFNKDLDFKKRIWNEERKFWERKERQYQLALQNHSIINKPPIDAIDAVDIPPFIYSDEYRIIWILGEEFPLGVPFDLLVKKSGLNSDRVRNVIFNLESKKSVSVGREGIYITTIALDFEGMGLYEKIKKKVK